VLSMPAAARAFRTPVRNRLGRRLLRTPGTNQRRRRSGPLQGRFTGGGSRQLRHFSPGWPSASRSSGGTCAQSWPPRRGVADLSNCPRSSATHQIAMKHPRLQQRSVSDSIRPSCRGPLSARSAAVAPSVRGPLPRAGKARSSYACRCRGDQGDAVGRHLPGAQMRRWLFVYYADHIDGSRRVESLPALSGYAEQRRAPRAAAVRHRSRASSQRPHRAA
jgi:hypothetical protein